MIFTGGIGENGVRVREQATAGLDHIGVVLDGQQNVDIGSGEGIFSADTSPVTLMVVPTNEELLIARDTCNIAGGSER